MLLLQTVHSSGSARNDTIKRGHCIEVVESRTIGMVYDPEDTSGTGSREYVRLRFYRSYVFAVMSIPVTIALDIFPQRSSAMDYTHSQANQLLANAEFLEPLAHAEAAFSRLAPVKHHDRRVDLLGMGAHTAGALGGLAEVEDFDPGALDMCAALLLLPSILLRLLLLLILPNCAGTTT